MVVALMLQGMSAAAVDEVPAPVVWVDPSDAWVTTSWVSASWAIDGEADVAGWALTVDQEPSSDPGQEITQLDPYWSDWLPDGVHWLHVRAVAPDGSVGAVAHTRLALDTLAPEVAGLTSVSHPAGEVSTTSTVQLSWPVPEDTSGVVGYQTVLSGADSPLEAEAEITTVTPEATVDVPGDGVWSINVRAVDAAGLWGPFSTYEVLVDAAAPQAPTVVGLPEPGASTSQRHLVARFASADPSDGVVGWVATVDHSPTASLDPAAARPESRLATILEPGQWWLHVAGVDATGRLGATSDIPIVVTADDYVLDVPAGRQLSGPARIEAICPAVTAAAVQAVAADGTRTDVGALTTPDGACGVDWDVIEERAGARVWPDGDYDLVVVEGGTDVSVPVRVTIAAEAGSVARISADHAAGLLTATEQADLLIQAIADPAGLPLGYQAGDVAEVPDAGTLISALMAGGEVPESLLGDLIPTVLDEPQARSMGRSLARSTPMGAADFQTSCNQRMTVLRIVLDCAATSDHFAVLYNSFGVDSPAPGSTLPAQVELALTSLERARTVYSDHGFAVPNWTLVVLHPNLGQGAGIALPSLNPLVPPVIVMSSKNIEEFLPHHEFFHQVQYQYLPSTAQALRVTSASADIYWWLEATANWGAHLVQSTDAVQSTDGKGTFPHQPTYANSLQTFLDNSANSLDSGTLIEPLTGGGPEYGAFPVAEFLQQQYVDAATDGAAAIEATWRKIGRLFLPLSAAGAIASVMADHGESYSEQIHLFRTWMYSLGHVEGFGGFTTTDAQPGQGAQPDGFWHHRLKTPHIEPAAEVSFGETHRQQSGTVRLGAGGAAYIEFTGPTDLSGQLTVTVGQGAAATLIEGVDGFPTICPRYTGPTLMAASSAPPAGHTSPLGSEEGYGCSNAVLVITNTALSKPWSSATTVSWTATFVPDKVRLQSDWLTLGVSNTGVLGYHSGVQRDGTYHVPMTDGWAVRDDEVTGQDFDYQSTRTVKPGVFTFNPERSTAYTGTPVGPIDLLHGAALHVRQSVHPSPDPNLYAVDVTVARPDPQFGQAPPADSHVYYRRSTSWDVTWSRFVWQMDSTWAKRPGGDDSRVIAVTNEATWYDQSVAPWGTAGYATSGQHWRASSTLDLDLGVIAPGDSVSFTLYYGVALTKADAEAAVAAVDADVFYLASPSWPAPDQSATGIFAYRATTPTNGATP